MPACRLDILASCNGGRRQQPEDRRWLARQRGRKGGRERFKDVQRTRGWLAASERKRERTGRVERKCLPARSSSAWVRRGSRAHRKIAASEVREIERSPASTGGPVEHEVHVLASVALSKDCCAGRHRELIERIEEHAELLDVQVSEDAALREQRHVVRALSGRKRKRHRSVLHWRTGDLGVEHGCSQRKEAAGGSGPSSRQAPAVRCEPCASAQIPRQRPVCG